MIFWFGPIFQKVDPPPGDATDVSETFRMDSGNFDIKIIWNMDFKNKEEFFFNL